MPNLDHWWFIVSVTLYGELYLGQHWLSGNGLPPAGTRSSAERCKPIIKCVLWHSPEGNYTRMVHELHPKYAFGDYTFKFTTTSHVAQWVNGSENTAGWQLSQYGLVFVRQSIHAFISCFHAFVSCYLAATLVKGEIIKTFLIISDFYFENIMKSSLISSFHAPLCNRHVLILQFHCFCF